MRPPLRACNATRVFRDRALREQGGRSVHPPPYTFTPIFSAFATASSIGPTM